MPTELSNEIDQVVLDFIEDNGGEAGHTAIWQKLDNVLRARRWTWGASRKRLLKAGLIEQLGRGRYRLAKRDEVIRDLKERSIEDAKPK